ncbi:MAG: hypothetical protein H0V79_05200 [Actinobacteria bacterium]|nr:hypothetical protein [Actinomycetota bacterium]
MPTTLSADLYERLNDRVRHAMQYAEAARLCAEDALDLLKATRDFQEDLDRRRGGDDD